MICINFDWTLDSVLTLPRYSGKPRNLFQVFLPAQQGCVCGSNPPFNQVTYSYGEHPEGIQLSATLTHLKNSLGTVPYKWTQ